LRISLALLLIPFALSCCGYSTTSRTAKGIKTIAVPFFENQTSEPALEINITERIIENLVDDNTLKVVDEEAADAVLDGVILTFANMPFSFNQELDAEEYVVVVTTELTLFNRKLNEPIWENKHIRGDGTYFLDATEGGMSYEDALEEAVKEITEQILNLTVKDW
jgi:hypothetical protein